MDRRTEIVLGYITRERKKALDLHGPLTRNYPRAAAILGEEFGEVCAAALEHGRPLPLVQSVKGYRNSGNIPNHGLNIEAERIGNLRMELAQVAAVAILWLENLEDEQQ